MGAAFCSDSRSIIVELPFELEEFARGIARGVAPDWSAQTRTRTNWLGPRLPGRKGNTAFLHSAAQKFGRDTEFNEIDDSLRLCRISAPQPLEQRSSELGEFRILRQPPVEFHPENYSYRTAALP